MEEMLKLLLDYQQFARDFQLQEMLEDLDERYQTALPTPIADEELLFNAAGEEGYLQQIDHKEDE